MALGGAVGATVAAKRFRRTGDADARWLITTRWATAGLILGIAVVLCHLTLRVP
jgi:hypothetical protein